MLRVTDDDGWLTRLAKLIPAEALAFYGTICGMIPAGQSHRQSYLVVLTVITLLFTISVRIWVTTYPNGRPQWSLVAISAISFLLWACALPAGSSPLDLPPNEQFIVPIISFIWVTLISTFYKPKTTVRPS